MTSAGVTGEQLLVPLLLLLLRALELEVRSLNVHVRNRWTTRIRLLPLRWMRMVRVGGYFPLKDLPEYRLPERDADDADYSGFYDVVENSVWRPRRVGEKTVKIALDDDFEEFCNNEELKVDGGVDCGRSPFPVSTCSRRKSSNSGSDVDM